MRSAFPPFSTARTRSRDVIPSPPGSAPARAHSWVADQVSGQKKAGLAADSIINSIDVFAAFRKPLAVLLPDDSGKRYGLLELLDWQPGQRDPERNQDMPEPRFKVFGSSLADYRPIFSPAVRGDDVRPP